MWFFDAAGTVNIAEGNTTKKLANSISYSIDDKFTIKRTGTTITYLINDVLIYTSTITIASTTPLGLKFLVNSSATPNSFGIINATITFNPNANVMFIGDILTKTGCFKKQFLTVDIPNASLLNFTINGIAAPVISYAGFNHLMPVPVSGSIVLNSTLSLFFNSDELLGLICSSYE
jgi:hypothetical protein